MHPSTQFLNVVRQYAALETRMNRDFSEPILHFSYLEAERLVSEGNTLEAAVSQINVWLAQEVQRFPVQMDNIPF